MSRPKNWLSHITFIITILILNVFLYAFEVKYWFESSYLNIQLTPPASYLVEASGKSITCQNFASITWKRGKVDWVLIKNLSTGEEKKLLVVGVHDFPPKIEIYFPNKVGLGTYPIETNLSDDWDSKENIKLDIYLDDKKLQQNMVDTFFLHSGSHIITTVATDSFGNISKKEEKFEVYIGFPSTPKVIYKEPDSVIFPEKPTLYFLYPTGIGVVKDVGMVSRDTAKIVRKIDKFGNKGEIFVIPPSPKDVTPISKKLVITSVNSNLLLLSGGSPFPVIGKVVIPESKTIVLGENTQINMSTGQLIVKGILMNISPKFVINGGVIKISENGQLYLNGGIINSKLTGERSDVVYLKHTTGLKELRIKNSQFLILDSVTLTTLECRKCKGVYIKNSQIDEVHISNTNNAILQDSSVTSLKIEEFTKGEIIRSNINSIYVNTLSKVFLYRSNIKNANINSASTFMTRESKIGQVSLDGFSLMKSFLSEFTGKILTVKSEVIQR